MLRLNTLRFAGPQSSRPQIMPPARFAASADHVQFGDGDKNKKTNFYQGKMTWEETKKLEKDLELDDKTFVDKLEAENWLKELEDDDINLINPDNTVEEKEE